jgi:hypothetical protein
MKRKMFGICGLVSGLALTLTQTAPAQLVPVNADQSMNERDGAFTVTVLPEIFGTGGQSQSGIAKPAMCLPALSKQHLKVAPRIAVDDSLRELGVSASVNWSGYAATATPAKSDTVYTVTGTWTVPTVTSTAGNGVAAYSAVWVGIDGFDDGTVEQLGTMQAAEVVSQGRRGGTQTETLYYAWTEMYPAGMVELPGTVKPGDVIMASVTWVSGGTCTLYMKDVTENWTYGPVNVAGSTSAEDMSAEWVVEAPSSYFGILPLADFGTVGFTGCSAEISSKTAGPIDGNGSTWDEMTMVTSNGRTVKAQPSGLTDAGSTSSFTVTWDHD